ncbi:MAG TPA: hypothetical protein VGM53_14260 [Streptosporangiaceae bacterium]
MANDWFRSPEWDEDARADFETRLARARPHNRQQYLRAAGHLDGARELLERAADRTDGYFVQTVAAWETLADMAVVRGDRESAEQLYRRILAEQPSLSGTTGSVEMSLAEILLDTGHPDALNEAFALLRSWTGRSGIKFDSQLFRWHLDVIRAAQAIGDQETVKTAASAALKLAARALSYRVTPTSGWCTRTALPFSACASSRASAPRPTPGHTSSGMACARWLQSWQQ